MYFFIFSIPVTNTDSHISVLLRYVHRQKLALIVDDSNKISSEYETKIVPAIRTSSETDAERYLLTYWFGEWSDVERHTVEVNRRDRLMVVPLRK